MSEYPQGFPEPGNEEDSYDRGNFSDLEKLKSEVCSIVVRHIPEFGTPDEKEIIISDDGTFGITLRWDINKEKAIELASEPINDIDDEESLDLVCTYDWDQSYIRFNVEQVRNDHNFNINYEVSIPEVEYSSSIDYIDEGPRDVVYER